MQSSRGAEGQKSELKLQILVVFSRSAAEIMLHDVWMRFASDLYDVVLNLKRAANNRSLEFNIMEDNLYSEESSGLCPECFSMIHNR